MAHLKMNTCLQLTLQTFHKKLTKYNQTIITYKVYSNKFSMENNNEI